MAKANFTRASVSGHLKTASQRIEREIINRLHILGLECVTIARNLETYNNVTGNLRSSIGYAILRNGKIVDSKFSPVTQEGVKGAATGKEYAEELAKKFPKGYVLIVCAGMAYAAEVERKGRDVLTSAELYAKEQKGRIISQLKKSMEKL